MEVNEEDYIQFKAWKDITDYEIKQDIQTRGIAIHVGESVYVLGHGDLCRLVGKSYFNMLSADVAEVTKLALYEYWMSLYRPKMISEEV